MFWHFSSVAFIEKNAERVPMAINNNNNNNNNNSVISGCIRPIYTIQQCSICTV